MIPIPPGIDVEIVEIEPARGGSPAMYEARLPPYGAREDVAEALRFLQALGRGAPEIRPATWAEIRPYGFDVEGMEAAIWGLVCLATELLNSAIDLSPAWASFLWSWLTMTSAEVERGRARLDREERHALIGLRSIDASLLGPLVTEIGP